MQPPVPLAVFDRVPVAVRPVYVRSSGVDAAV